MAEVYSPEVCKALEEKFRAARLHRPMRIERYDAGREFAYDVTGVSGGDKARIRLVVEAFVGGGYAGQVYRVKVLSIENGHPDLIGIEAGGLYAMKILVPPSSFSRHFRNLLYRIGFQGPFQLQVNPDAVRAGAMWQKFIRRAAKIRFGSEEAVADVYATFVDENLGSCGEIREWVEGRTWRLEADEHLDSLKRWLKGEKVDPQNLGSPEYRAKRMFMKSFVQLLHEMGAYELARQYEWSTCKSQPNCLKRENTIAEGGLVAVDFRAGLTLLPFGPMSPGDFKLIINGLSRGSLVQFDRGDINKLKQFVNAHGEDFADIRQIVDELKALERVYRDSVPDVTHNHIRLLYSRRLWSTIFDSAVTGWKVRNLVDEENEQRLRRNRFITFLFFFIGAIPFFGSCLRRFWGRMDWREHYREMLTSLDYLGRSIRARIAEKVIVWHRAGRVGPERALRLQEKFLLFLYHLPLSVLPAGLHRFLTDRAFFKDKLHYIFVRPVKLYFSASYREQWLRDMIEDGKKKHILTDEDAETILSQLQERYIQRYLISVAVHFLTVPVTQIVSVIVAWIYYQRTGDTLGAGGILVLFQIIPISPGSICRGLYAVGIAIYDRSFKDYNIAVFLSFVKYIGYLAFPIQMTYRYPALARFMAAHWATAAVHIVPVFGERGALLEHGVFYLFYNRPLTVRRRIRERAEERAGMPARYWHIGLAAIGGAIMLVIANLIYHEMWWFSGVVSLACGVAVSLGCGGASLKKRFVWAAICGAGLGIFYTAGSVWVGLIEQSGFNHVAAYCVWRVFIFGILSTVAAIVTEMRLS